MKAVTARIAEELGVREAQVAAAAALLDGGATVPFIARYRKETTGGLDDTQLRKLEERLCYLRDLDDRRRAIVASIAAQDRMTPALAASLDAAETKAPAGGSLSTLPPQAPFQGADPRAKPGSNRWRRRSWRGPSGRRKLSRPPSCRTSAAWPMSRRPWMEPARS